MSALYYIPNRQKEYMWQIMHVYEKSTVWLASVGLAQVRPNKLQSSHYVYPAAVAVGKVDEHQPNRGR